MTGQKERPGLELPGLPNAKTTGIGSGTNGTDQPTPVQSASPSGKRHIVKTYSWVDEESHELFQTVRYEPKDFRQRHRDPVTNEWVWNLNGCRRVPYHLPQLMDGVAVGATVYQVEGERDVESLEAIGEVATCNPMGAGVGKWRPEYNEFFRDADVVIVADWDSEASGYAGQAHAKTIYDNLIFVARRVRIVRAKTGKDVTDHLNAGHSLADLVPVRPDALPSAPYAAATATKASETTVSVSAGLHRVLGWLAVIGDIKAPSQPGGDWQVCCPVHNDTRPSATVNVGHDRPVIFHCHKGCTQQQFIDEMVASGIPLADLMERPKDSSAGVGTWMLKDLTAALAGEETDLPPSVLRRSDGKCLFYSQALNTVQGESESGKSWLALLAAAQSLADGSHVLYIDMEDRESRVVRRLLDAGVEADHIRLNFHYIRPDEKFSAAAHRYVGEQLDTYRPVLVVIDGVTEAMALEGLSILDNDDIAEFYKSVPRFIVDRASVPTALVMIDHVTKDREGRGRHAIGGQHKLAGVDGAVFLVENRQPFGRTRQGYSSVAVVKDRSGFVREWAGPGKYGIQPVGILALDATQTPLRLTLTAPGEVADDSFVSPGAIDAMQLTIGKALAAVAEPVNVGAIKKLVGKKGADVGLALLQMERRGWLLVTPGAKSNEKLHSLTPLYQEEVGA